MEGKVPNNERKRLPIVDDYEKEKIESSARDLELTAGTLRAVIDIANFAKKNNIPIERANSEFDTLRLPDKDFGPGGEIEKVLNGLLQRAREEQKNIHDQFNDQQKKDWILFIQQKKEIGVQSSNEKINKIANDVSTIVAHLEANDYEGQNAEKLKSDIFLITNQIKQIRDSKVPEELTEAANRMDSIQHIPSDKSYIQNELFKVKNLLKFLSGELKQKPD